jgi:streptogrisin C
VVVASGTTSSNNETVSYSGTAGYYEWEVRSYSGGGSYSLYLKHP